MSAPGRTVRPQRGVRVVQGGSSQRSRRSRDQGSPRRRLGADEVAEVRLSDCWSMFHGGYLTPSCDSRSQRGASGGRSGGPLIFKRACLSLPQLADAVGLRRANHELAGEAVDVEERLDFADHPAERELALLSGRGLPRAPSIDDPFRKQCTRRNPCLRPVLAPSSALGSAVTMRCFERQAVKARKGGGMGNTMSFFTDGQAYERLMGRWSRAAGETFLDWLSPPKGLNWLDVGCGTSAFTELVIDRCAPVHITAIDPAEDQIAYARNRPIKMRAAFLVGMRSPCRSRITNSTSLPWRWSLASFPMRRRPWPR